MNTSRWIQLGAAFGAMVLVGVAAVHQPGINNGRQNLELVFNEDLRKNLSPDIAWRTAMLGSFRGLLVNMLWVRIERLKEEGKYYEASGLAEEICKLQPRFPPVWVFHSWNMAWNISVATHTPEERWKWVYNGVRLIRDRGILYNPRSNWLYRQVAWIYFNKMGEWTDDMHRDYKRMWAYKMQQVLGPRIADATTERVLAAFKPIAEAPETVEQFIAADPGNGDLVQGLVRLGLPLSDDVSLNESDSQSLRSLLDVEVFLAQYWEVTHAEVSLASLRRSDAEQTRIEELPLKAFLDSIQPPERRARLIAFVQAFVLRKRYQLDPVLMYELMEKYGPLDWRTVESHGVYWTVLGTRRSPTWEINDELDRLNTERILLYAMRNLSRRGWLVFEPNLGDIFHSYFNQLPDLRFIDITHKLYLALSERYHATKTWQAEGGGQYLGSGHQFFLQEAVRQLYFNGDEEKAAYYYKYLRENFLEKGPDGKDRVKSMYTRELQDFVLGEVRGQIDIFRGASDTINGLLFYALINLATGEGERFAKGFNQARKLWDSYMEQRKNDENPRRQLPDFQRMCRDLLAVFLRERGVVGIVGKARVWEHLPVPLKQAVWDQVSQTLEQMCRQYDPPIDMKKAFPEPPDMDAYRKAHPSRPDTKIPQSPDRMVPDSRPAGGPVR